MPNIKSAEKRLRQSQVRRARNRPVKTFARNEVREAIAQIEEGGDGAAAVKAATSALDRATQKGLIHKNSAARTKSRLMKRLNAGQASA